MKTLCRLVIAVFVVAVPVVRTYPAPKETSDSKVKITAEAGKPGADGKQTVTLNLDIAKGWHLYANPVGNQSFTESQTVVKIKAGQALKELKIEYPAGKVVKDTIVGDYKVYEGKVAIKAQVVRAPGDNSALDVSVDVQACDDNNCLFPATVKLTVK